MKAEELFLAIGQAEDWQLLESETSCQEVIELKKSSKLIRNLLVAAALTALDSGGEQAASADKTAEETSAVYTVRKGDTLWGIAKRYGVTLTALIAANPQIKNPNLIYPGDRVRIP